MWDNGKRIAEYEYNADDTIKRLKNGSLYTEYAYDADRNLTGLKTMLGTDTIVDNRYTYDGNGDRLEKLQKHGTTRYGYDNMRRLAKVEYPNAAEELFYDKAGNRTKRLYNGAEELYQYDRRNRLTTYTRGGASTQYEYDNAGNLLKDDKARYEYDAFNRSTRVETFNGNIQINRYDAEGLRHEMEENGKLVSFIFRGDEVVTEESQEDKIRYIRTSVLLASDAESARTYYHYASDEMSSITHVVDGENAEILNRYEYDAWGNLTTCEEKVPNRFKFNGQQYDPISQQYYLRARYYNPVIGRFTQEDSYNVDGLNLYAYCMNNPLSYIDPSGNICDKAKDAIIEKLKNNQATRNEQKKLAAYLRNKERKKGLTDDERSILNKIDGYTYLNRYENQHQNRQNATEENSNKSSSNTIVPDSTQFPQTRLDIHNDLISRGYYSTGTIDRGYVVYRDGKGHEVTIKPEGEVIPVTKLPKDPNNTSPKAPKYSQRTYYDGTIIPDELNDHTTGHNVGRISVDDFYPEPYKWEGIATWMKENSK
ncbi:MAG: hypothetical protein K2O91_18755 [Lachnospiraceae bacterium]|nr:hypothetical protein [Lachnospiraceae bacterium]